MITFAFLVASFSTCPKKSWHLQNEYASRSNKREPETYPLSAILLTKSQSYLSSPLFSLPLSCTSILFTYTRIFPDIGSMKTSFEPSRLTYLPTISSRLHPSSFTPRPFSLTGYKADLISPQRVP